jgi:ribosome-binding factor A
VLRADGDRAQGELMPRESARKHRIATEIQRLLNELLLTEVKDPRLSGARVSDVEVTGDLSLATIYFNTLGLDDDPAPIKEGFEQARGFFRSQVGRALQLRRVPDLRFRHDASARRAVEIGKLIDDARGTGGDAD